MPNHSPGVVGAITACALTLVLTSCDVAPTPSTCTPQPVSGVDDRGLHELSSAVQSCANDVATSFKNLDQLNNPDQQGKQTTFADTVVQGLDAFKSCRDLVAKVQEKMQERRANKEANKGQARKDLADYIHQGEPKIEMEYRAIKDNRAIEEPPAIEKPQEPQRRREPERHRRMPP